MVDLSNKDYIPNKADFEEAIGNPVFNQFCFDVEEKFKRSGKAGYSSCSLEKGWNMKFKKSTGNLCTIYPRDGFFTVMVVIGRKEKDAVEAILPESDERLQELYSNTREFNGQRWLMIDLEDKDKIYDDIMKLLEIRNRR